MLIEIFSSSETRRKAYRLKASEWKLVSIDTTIISFEKGRKKNLVSARRCCMHTRTHTQKRAILGKDYSRLEQRTRKVVRPCIHLNDLSPWRLVIMHNPFLPVYSAAFQFAGTN